MSMCSKEEQIRLNEQYLTQPYDGFTVYRQVESSVGVNKFMGIKMDSFKSFWSACEVWEFQHIPIKPISFADIMLPMPEVQLFEERGNEVMDWKIALERRKEERR